MAHHKNGRRQPPAGSPFVERLDPQAHRALLDLQREFGPGAVRVLVGTLVCEASRVTIRHGLETDAAAMGLTVAEFRKRLDLVPLGAGQLDSQRAEDPLAPSGTTPAPSVTPQEN